MYPRLILPQVQAALADTPVVLVNGPRQSGKTTLVSELVPKATERRYVTFDDLVVQAAARSDPAAFVANLSGTVSIDEVQRVPQIFLPIKAAVDRERSAGRFLLTGSANALALPKVADSLAGRIEIVSLWPLAQAEIESASNSNFVDALLNGTAGDHAAAPAEPRGESFDRLLAGGYPAALERSDVNRRDAWFASYLATVLERDVRDLAGIENLTVLPRLLALLCSRSGGLLNSADLASGLGLSRPTISKYVTILERLFLVRIVPAWARRVSVRLTKAPKVFAVDTGLAAHLLGADRARIELDGALAGSLFESFVVGEIFKLASWSAAKPAISYFRTSDGREVDVVVETRSGDVAGIEVKAGQTVTSSDFRGLRTLADLTGPRFAGGVVVYTGAETVAFGERLFAVPVSRLWR
ncbi:MAG: ATP-binding protein [Acidobacteria bacterium]|nr:ATP-binding protein [Acidobacteriota bacterium]